MANLFVHHLRSKEAEDVRKSDVLNWYLMTIVSGAGDDLSQEDILEKKQQQEDGNQKETMTVPIEKEKDVA